MLNVSLPWWEFIVRGAVIYGFLLVALRLLGSRPMAQMTKFDLVMLLILSNAVQNSMNGGDNSLIGGLILATTLILANYGLHRLVLSSKSVERAVEGEAQILVRNGKVFRKVLDRANITDRALDAALREAGIGHVNDVHVAILEADGKISVLGKHDDAVVAGSTPDAFTKARHGT